MSGLLDLFCGAGGAAMGYHRAGFEVVGVDINPQPHYPFEFRKLTRGPGSDWWSFDASTQAPPARSSASRPTWQRALGKKASEVDL